MTPANRPGYARPTPKPVYRVHNGRSGGTPLGALNLLAWLELAAIFGIAAIASKMFLA